MLEITKKDFLVFILHLQSISLNGYIRIHLANTLLINI